ncbi:hypothetical protein DWY93_03600 [Clostridium sp. AF28-12]|nr:hypothetical protein DWY93_03600 [Clostridium sp. AF28-12]
MCYIKGKVLDKLALQKNGYMTAGTFVNIRAGKMVSPDKLDAICDLLDMQQGDIIGFKRGKEDV